MSAAAATSAEKSPESAAERAAARVGEVFAKALVGAAGKDVDAVVADLDAVVGELLNKVPQFELTISSAMISGEQKAKLIDKVLGGKVSPVLLNFLKVLVEHDRGSALRSVQRSAHDLLDTLHRRVRVQVTTATVLDEQSAQKLVEPLRRMIGGEPMLERSVDPSLIGGVVFRIGDTVFDGSVVTQLERMRTQLLNRSVHEIQSGRDRFSPPEGN
jgi:F-type H+-transporting ATPase subunit delta